MKSKLKPVLAAAGIIIILSLVCIAMLLYIGRDTDISDKTVLVEVDGKSLYAVPLSADNELLVISRGGRNKVVIKNGEAFVSEADCANQICVNSKPVSKVGESIVCLPHRVVVSVIRTPYLE